jgi:hypothetical protein
MNEFARIFCLSCLWIKFTKEYELIISKNNDLTRNSSKVHSN